MDPSSGSIQFGRIVRDDAAFVARVLRRFGVRSADLDDARQDVFLVVHRRLPEFEARGSYRSWLYRICVCVAADYRKRAHRRRELPDETGGEPSSAAQAERLASTAQLARSLERALERLDAGKREVFVLYEFEELTVAEIAAQLACPLKTAFSRLYAARRELAADLRRAGYASVPALLLWLPTFRAKALAGGNFGLALCAVSAVVITLAPLPAAVPHGDLRLAPLPAAASAVRVSAPPIVEPALADPAPALESPRPVRKRAPRAARPKPAAPVASAWISAPDPAPALEPAQSPPPRAVGLDEVLSATSIRPLLRVGPATGKSFTLVPR